MMYWALSVCTIIGGIAGVWYFWDKIVAWCARGFPVPPEMPVSHRMSAEMGLEEFLNAQGCRLFWGNVAERDYYLRFGDYELINWIDDQGKTWTLSPAPGEDLPLKTTFQPKQIEERRRQRVMKGLGS